MTTMITSPILYVTCFGDLTVHVKDGTTDNALCGEHHSSILYREDDRFRWFDRCADCTDKLHAEALAEYAGGTWCVSCLQANITPRHQVPAAPPSAASPAPRTAPPTTRRRGAARPADQLHPWRPRPPAGGACVRCLSISLSAQTRSLTIAAISSGLHPTAFANEAYVHRAGSDRRSCRTRRLRCSRWRSASFSAAATA